MDKFAFLKNIQEWSDQYPWLEMLTSLSILIFFAFVANYIAKQVVVRGIRKLISKMKFAHSEIFSQHSVIRRVANIVPAIIILNGITTVPHLSLKAVGLIQMAAQAFIFLTIALAISELLNVFNLLYQRNPKSLNKPIKGYLQLIKLILFIVCGLLISIILLVGDADVRQLNRRGCLRILLVSRHNNLL